MGPGDSMNVATFGPSRTLSFGRYASPDAHSGTAAAASVPIVQSVPIEAWTTKGEFVTRMRVPGRELGIPVTP